MTPQRQRRRHTTISPQPALFEAFNANKMELAEIVDGFVIPTQYREIVAPNNTIIVGPRGSGKTTLLRMLEGPALGLWKKRAARSYRSRISYSSVFVPADKLWSTQLEYAPAGAPPELIESIAVSAFVTQVLTALVDVMRYRVGRSEWGSVGVQHPCALSPDAEERLVHHLAGLWLLEPWTYTLESLIEALEIRSSQLSRFVPRSGPVAPFVTGLDDTPAWLSLSLTEASTQAARAFNRASGEAEHRWCLLFDEMELAPTPVHQMVIDALRGGRPEVLYKLSFSPFDGDVEFVHNLSAALPDNDYRIVQLWYGRRDGALRFSRDLLAKMLEEDRRRQVSPVDLFGRSSFDTKGQEWDEGTAYRYGSDQQKLIRSHYDRDGAFRSYLDRMSISPDRLERVSKRKRAYTLRKVYPLLVFRDAFIDFRGGRPVRRMRKKPTEAYTGSEAVFALLEGNPRWFRAVVSQMLAATPSGRVSRGVQFDALSEARERFRALLRMLPSAAGGVDQNGDELPAVFVLDVIDRIIGYFVLETHGEFTPDPAGSFVVDGGVDAPTVAALQTALNAGAIVRLDSRKPRQAEPERRVEVLGDIVGSRFRIAYLLCVGKDSEVPIRLGREVQLSTILARSRSREELMALDSARHVVGNRSGQRELFTEVDS